VLVLAVCAADVFGTWVAWNSYSVVEDYLAGLPGVDDGELFAADNATTTAFWLSLLAIAASATVFLTWLWRARGNSELMSATEHRLSRGWTIGAWFCPVVNLWFPRRIMDDIWRSSHPDVRADKHLVASLPLSPLVRVWWFTVIADYVMWFLHRLQSRNSEVTLGSLKTLAVYSTISTVLVIASGILLIRVIRQITEWQSAPPPATADAPQGDSSSVRPGLAHPRPHWGGEHRS
jgi:hypothetical protein